MTKSDYYDKVLLALLIPREFIMFTKDYDVMQVTIPLKRDNLRPYVQVSLQLTVGLSVHIDKT
jgi:hypothetical protein